jgi:CubicO group peptidase (beta-lactamase class C family)
MNKVINILNKAIEQKDFPGVALSMIDSNKQYTNIHLGYKEIYPNLVKVNGYEIYDIASLTKVVFTTTAIMQLIEKKQLQLNTPIQYVLPWFKHQEITVYDVLIHSSGLPADIRSSYLLKTKEDVISRIKEMETIYVKGTYIVYSDVGFILLGLMIEKITGLSLDAYGKKNIFMPLNMLDTSFHPDKLRAAPTEYRSDQTYEGLLRGIVHDEKAFALKEAGHAGLFSTSEDLIKFCSSLLDDERILKRETIALLMKLQIKTTDLNGDIKARALGWQKPTENSYAGEYIDDDTAMIHTGFTGCHMIIDHKKHIAYVMLSNAVHPKREMNHIIKYRSIISNYILKEREK